MENVQISKCLVELDEILKYLDIKELEKIPSEIRKAITEQKDKEYKWEYDKSKELIDQNINRQTIIMLAHLNMEYLLNEKQKAYMKKMHEDNEEKIEQEKRNKYNPNDIFKNHIVQQEKEKEEEIALVEIKKEKWYKKIFSFFKKILKK